MKSKKSSKTGSSKDHAASELIISQAVTREKSLKTVIQKEVSNKINKNNSEKANVRADQVSLLSTVNMVYRKRDDDCITFGKVPGNNTPEQFTFDMFEEVVLVPEDIKTFEDTSILVKGKEREQGWKQYLLDKWPRRYFFYDRTTNNMTLVKEYGELETDSDISTADKNDEIGDHFDFSTFNEFNVVWAFPNKKELGFGRIHTDDTSTIINFTNRKFTSVRIGSDRLREIKALPLVVDEEQGDQPWYDGLLKKHRRYYWFFNKHLGIIAKTNVSCAPKGGFPITRQEATTSGIQVSTVQEFNNVGASFQYTSWPREPIKGDKGYCALIAAYYICLDLSMTLFLKLQTELHTEIAVSGNSTIFVTDGSRRIVKCINESMSTSFLQQVFPSKKESSSQQFTTAVFGLADCGGKFLIEMRNEKVSTPIGISHFVSVDTNKLEIYDPMSSREAILTQRNIHGYILFLETLHLVHSVKVVRIWKLVNKTKRTFSKMSDEELPKKKKRKGNKRLKRMYF